MQSAWALTYGDQEPSRLQASQRKVRFGHALVCLCKENLAAVGQSCRRAHGRGKGGPLGDNSSNSGEGEGGINQQGRRGTNRHDEEATNYE